MNDCCYITIYTSYPFNRIFRNIYGVITDIYGVAIEIEGNINFEDILLINGSKYDIDPQIYNLPMISNDNICYFMITYGNSSINDNDNSDTIIVEIFYLSYDNNNMKYSLQNVGYFNTIQLINSYYNFFDNYWTYIMPDTNELFFSWSQFDYVNWDTGSYAQAWTIN